MVRAVDTPRNMARVNMVVERGLARCPRCVSMADYVFIETVSEEASPVTRYEVSCRKCGECYGEESWPPQHAPVAPCEPPIVWPRDCEPLPTRDWRQELRERLGRLTTAAADRAGRLRGETQTLVRVHARNSARVIQERVPRRWGGGRTEANSNPADDQTGG